MDDATAAPAAGLEGLGDWVRAELARDALRTLADGLAETGVRLMVFKGVHLAFAVADRPDFRPLSDADAIVVQGSHGAAVRWARASGRYRVRHDDWSVTMLLDARDRAVDLHRRPLPAFFGRLDAAALLRRATVRPELFGAHVHVPDAVDAAALSLAHFVKDKVGAYGPVRVEADLEVLARNAGVEPVGLAARLREHGLRRVGLVAFAALEDRGFDAGPWLDAAAPTRGERTWARTIARRLAGKHARAEAFLLARTIGDSPRAIAANLVLGSAVRVPWIALERASRVAPRLRWI